MKIFQNHPLLSAAVVAVAAFGFSQSAEAALINSVLRGGGNIYVPVYDGQSVSAGKNFVAGAGVEFGFGPASVIADVLYAKRSVEYPNVYTENLAYVHIPVQGQLSLGLFHFSGGLYWAKGVGTVQRKVGADAPTTRSFADAGLSDTDYGAVAGFGVGIPLGVTSLGADIRYNLGMKNVATGASSKKNRSIDLLVSFSF